MPTSPTVAEPLARTGLGDRRRQLLGLSALLPWQALAQGLPASGGTAPAKTVAPGGPPLALAGVLELSGPGIVAGTNFRNGIEMAVRDINEAGGVLGRPLSFSVQDTQSKPEVALKLVTAAVESGAPAVLGPVFSGSMLVAMEATRNPAVPHLTGAEAAAVTEKGHPSVVRTAFTQAIGIPKMALYLAQRSGVKKLAVLHVNNDFGKGGLEVLRKALAGSGCEVLGAVSVEQAQEDMSAAVKQLLGLQPDGVFVYTNELESPRVLKELRRQGWSKPVYGETTLIGQKVIEQAGEAANGVIAHVGLPVDAPLPAIRQFRQRYEAHYKTTPDHNSLKGYSGVWVYKAAVERAGRVDRAAVVAALKGLKVSTHKHPGVLLYTEYDQKGDLDRMSFLMTVKNGQQEVMDFLSTLSMGLSGTGKR
ncbi:ABC transporter substrate-binding protein [Ideonella livida]|uniref:Amino acid ABC transporter substrate-binding protein n=1 Tax=Ideonella livida TaxID=2707176 RepID=A0A7C9PJ21_9BURK|nr:ABC transporter substrate-binding protein [Ideonella livida]NDY93048.1 amino acid ABC transporter substrate-binding protein [Ideonella livida]